MNKKLLLTFVMIVLCFILVGCGFQKKEDKDNGDDSKKYHSSFEAIMERTCYIVTNKVAYNEYFDIYLPAKRLEMEKKVLKSQWEELIEKNSSIGKKCTYDNVKKLTEEEIKEGEEWFADDMDVEIDFLECVTCYIHIESENSDDVTACKLKEDNKWYIIQF